MRRGSIRAGRKILSSDGGASHQRPLESGASNGTPRPRSALRQRSTAQASNQPSQRIPGAACRKGEQSHSVSYYRRPGRHLLTCQVAGGVTCGRQAAGVTGREGGRELREATSSRGPPAAARAPATANSFQPAAIRAEPSAVAAHTGRQPLPAKLRRVRPVGGPAGARYIGIRPSLAAPASAPAPAPASDARPARLPVGWWESGVEGGGRRPPPPLPLTADLARGCAAVVGRAPATSLCAAPKKI
ncbi:cyclin-dependent kinase inhibitor 1C-like [Schistocerca americana]|uniref:cyclin-dependent kinase inhibitor 1C-like n=1 Tax=Schistocerca americana TaxID=7009 RepID=UPI001F502A31|nr:cyclin-dependent kinase inhibitor 1C-like [Schistocerca americana]